MFQNGAFQKQSASALSCVDESNNSIRCQSRNNNPTSALIRKKNRDEKSIIIRKSSPFSVDLVAENERIDEENEVRLRQQLKRQKAAEKRRQDAKNEIILRALREANELDDLRRERRLILEEERRLKALCDIERTKAHRKEDRIAAVRAERRRIVAKNKHRLVENRNLLMEEEKTQKNILRLKHNISMPPDNTFSSYSLNS